MKKISALLLTFIVYAYTTTGPVIYLHFLPYNHKEDTQSLRKRQQRWLRRAQEKTVGVVATYAGYVETSDMESDLAFPRKHTSDIVDIIITPKITPVMRQSNLVSHWHIDKAQQTAMYRFEKTKTPENKTIWRVTKQTLPDNMRIPIESIVIIAKSKNIHVPLGEFSTEGGSNLDVPPLYIKPHLRTKKNALYMTNLNILFGQISPLLSKDEKTLARQLAD